MLLHVVRIVLLALMSFLTIGLVVALANEETGPIEKIVLAVFVIGVIAASAPVRRIGAVRGHR
jgi:hypothetical protein